MSGRCVLLHRWSKWEKGVGTYEAGPIGRRLGLPQEWQQEIQARRCSRCGKIQTEKLS